MERSSTDATPSSPGVDMEAVALWDFTARAPDELSFSKGDPLNVVESDNDSNWYQAERCDGDSPRRVGHIPANYVKMTRPPWFHGEMSRRSADAMLMKVDVPGAFLIRSSYHGFHFSVKVHRQGDQAWVDGGKNRQLHLRDHVQHWKVLRDDHGKYFTWTTKFKSLSALVKHYATASVSRCEDIFLFRALSKEGKIVPALAWSIKTHASMPKTVRSAVMTMLLIQHRAQELKRQQPHGHAQPGGADSATTAVSMSATAVTAATALETSYAAITTSFPSTISIFACPPMSIDDGGPAPVVLSHVDDANSHKVGGLAALLSTVPCEMVLAILGFLSTSETRSSVESQPHVQRDRSTIADYTDRGNTVETFAVTAQYNFVPQEAGELRFEKGDLIQVTDASDNNWWRGAFGGKAGLFPATYVRKNPFEVAPAAPQPGLGPVSGRPGGCVAQQLTPNGSEKGQIEPS